MMKKNGFTLAEVLITLAIIGVVATMTLPALMTNTAEQQYTTGLKKGINVLTEAAQMNQAVAGYDYASLTEDSAAEDQESQSLYGLLAQRTTFDFNKSGEGKQDSNGATTGNYVVFFRDGSSLMFSKTLKSDATNGALQSDGLPLGLTAVYDINGAKGPNQVSNCKGESTGLAGTDENDITKCTKAKRVIKDQFGVKLRGGYAFPNGAAARWAFEKS